MTTTAFCFLVALLQTSSCAAFHVGGGSRLTSSNSMIRLASTQSSTDRGQLSQSASPTPFYAQPSSGTMTASPKVLVPPTPLNLIPSALDKEKYLRSPSFFPEVTGGRRSAWEQLPEVRAAPMFPMELVMDRIEGIGTRRNYKIPPWAERAQYIITTNGRPLKAKVELWIGPIRTVHTLNIDVENGQRTPVRATLKFKKGTEVITIKTSEAGELPISACVFVPSPERSAEIGAFTDKVWKENQRTKIQGGIIQPDGKSKGAVRYFNVPAEVEAVQIIVWSKDTGKKSFKCKIELLQGPNNPKQSFELQCGGGTQPYHAIFETPGAGHVIRIINQKFLEDGLFEVAIVPIALPSVNVATKPAPVAPYGGF